jgi:hypothetical protein
VGPGPVRAASGHHHPAGVRVRRRHHLRDQAGHCTSCPSDVGLVPQPLVGSGRRRQQPAGVGPAGGQRMAVRDRGVVG